MSSKGKNLPFKSNQREVRIIGKNLKRNDI